MAPTEFDVAQQDSLQKLRVRFREQQRAGVDAEMAQRSLDNLLRTVTLVDGLTVDQLARGTGIAVDEIFAALDRISDRPSDGDGGFSERFALAYPEEAAEQERRRAISNARKEGLLQRLRDAKNSAADE